jgi:hypothetical protein
MPLFDRTLALSGDVAYLRFTMTWAGESWQNENRAWEFLQKTKPQLDDQIKEAVRKQLGTEFEVRSTVVLRASIEIIVIIGTTYYAISKYKNFMDSMELLKSQLKGLIRRFVDPDGLEPMTISDSLTPGPTLARMDGGLQSAALNDPTTIILLLYLILSHAALLTLLIWMAAKGVIK